MSTSNTKILASALAPLVGLSIPAAGLSAAPNAALTVEFRSADGVLLADDHAIKPQMPTFFVVHGFRDKGSSAASLRQAKAIRQRAPGANVIVVDWQVPPAPRSAVFSRRFSWLKGIDAITCELMTVDANYRRAVAAASKVGKRMAEWMEENGIRPSSTVISGHSLGAQIAAFAGNACARPELFDEPLAAIVAADPAGPRFEDRPPDGRLSQDDAQYVIVVHATDVWGDENRIGTLDVYIDWPKTGTPDFTRQHSQARELVTASFLRPDLSNTDGTPFAANALGVDFRDDQPRFFRPAAEATAEPLSLGKEGHNPSSPDSRISAADRDR